ncbi:MAG: cupin domain-containing protein [Alphaproteobacteria bacterium]
MTTATSPAAPHLADLPPLRSRFVDVDAAPWEPSRFPGIETKTLLVDRTSGLLTVLMRMAPGARLPDHEHVLIEQTWVIEGRLVDPDGEAGAGSFVWRPAGSRHDAWAPDGALMLAVFTAPNKFFESDGAVVDFMGQDWEGAWGDAVRRAAGRAGQR